MLDILVDGQNPANHQGWYDDDYPTIHRVSTIPSGAGFLPSTVALDRNVWIPIFFFFFQCVFRNQVSFFELFFFCEACWFESIHLSMWCGGSTSIRKVFFNVAIPHGLINFWFDDSWHWVKDNVSWFTTQAERSCGQGSQKLSYTSIALYGNVADQKRCSCSSDSEFLQNSAHFLFFKDKIRDPATRFHRLDDPQAAWKVS